MLIHFVVENFRCFKEEAILNLYPAKRLREHKDHLLVDDKGFSVRALPVLAIYGANASGKSTLVSAIEFARRMIVEGTRGEQKIPTIPYRLDSGMAKKPSRFEFVVKYAGVLYTYGFVISAERVEEEWLFANTSKQEERLFERIASGGQAKVETGDVLGATPEERQRLQFVAQGTRPNQLFLTEATERNVEALKPLMRWFAENLVIIKPDSTYSSLELRAYRDKDFANFLGELLKTADTGISAVTSHSEPLDFEQQLPGISEEMRQEMLDSLSKDKGAMLVNAGLSKFFTLWKNAKDQAPEMLSLKTSHLASNGKPVEFETDEESDGTRRVMHLAPALLDLQRSETTYVVDELDRSLHPHLSKFFIEAFLAGITKTASKGQLIFTTHETSLLDRDILRPDEIWFLEKDRNGASHLSNLSEYRLHHTLKIEKGYLNGRFGAIPLVGDVRRLLK